MAFNGSGIFVRLYNFVNDRDASIPIDSTRMDAELDGMATALSNCVTADGQTTTTAVVPFAAGISLYDGLVSAPAVRFTSDTNTGYYRKGADNVAFACQGIDVLELNGAASTAATGIRITSAAAGSGVAVAATSSGTNETLRIDAKGSGAVAIGTVSTGGVAVSTAIFPASNDGASVGASAFRFSDGYFATGAVLSFGSSGPVTITHSADTLTVDATLAANIFKPTKLNFGTPTELTISGGVVAMTRSYHTIDTESDAATDDLNTITGGTEGDILILRAANGSRDVVVKHGTGNIRNGNGGLDRTLSNTNQSAMYVYDGTNWLETSFSNVAA